jgi:hypothetical protein
VSNADLFVEAVDTAITLGRWFVGWLIVGAVMASILTLAAIATSAWAVDVVLDRLYGRRRGVDAPETEPEPDDTPEPPRGRRRPTWADEQPTTYEEAA